MTERAPALQTQEAELKAAGEKLAQASAKALRLEKDLHEACRQLAVLAEDDQDLRDKVSLCSIWHVPDSTLQCWPRTTKVSVMWLVLHHMQAKTAVPTYVVLPKVAVSMCGILHRVAYHALFTTCAAK